MSALADLFSALGSLKRRGADMLKNPGLHVQRTLGQASDDLNAYRELEKQAFGDPKDFLKVTDEKAHQQLLDTLMSTVTGAAPAGMLRVGGRPDLMAFHMANTKGLAQLAEWAKVKPGKAAIELYSPSFAVMQNRLSDKFGQTILVPRVGAFDPATYPSTLFNRDAYTPRWPAFSESLRADFLPKNLQTSPYFQQHIANLQKKLGGTPDDWNRAVARNRLRDRDLINAPKEWIGKEGGHPLGPIGDNFTGVHKDAAFASPAFKSYKQYEQLPSGADLLVEEGSGKVHGAADAAIRNFAHNTRLGKALDARFDISYGDKAISDIMYKGSLEMQQYQRSPGYMKDLADYRRVMQKIPSEYGELKVAGPVPVTKEHFAGILTPSAGFDVPSGKALKAYADKMDLPIVGYGHTNQDLIPGPWQPPSHGFNFVHGAHALHRDPFAALFEIANILQQQAGPARRSPIK